VEIIAIPNAKAAVTEYFQRRGYNVTNTTRPNIVTANKGATRYVVLTHSKVQPRVFSRKPYFATTTEAVNEALSTAHDNDAVPIAIVYHLRGQKEGWTCANLACLVNAKHRHERGKETKLFPLATFEPFDLVNAEPLPDLAWAIVEESDGDE